MYRIALTLILPALLLAMVQRGDAQSLDDLFGAPAAVQSPESNEGDALSSPSAADIRTERPDNASETNEGPTTNRASAIRLSRTRGSQVTSTSSMAMTLRQQRALMQSQSRIARMERDRWAGNHAHRPSWNPNPYSALRSPIRHSVMVPVYVPSFR